jgi:glycine oxidase
VSNRTIVVGGGIIGLSIAFELSERGEQVTVLEQMKFAGQASWAGAGMLPPANRATAVHPFEHLEAISNDLHPLWARRLAEKAGIDTGYRKCGSLYLARTFGEVASLVGAMHEWDDRGIIFERLKAGEISKRLEVGSAANLAEFKMAAWVPEAAQFHNPHHNQALVIGCQKNGVTLLENLGQVVVDAAGGKIHSVKGPRQVFKGDQFIFSSGAWTEKLVGEFGVSLPMQPVRGQMSLYRLPPSLAKNWQDAPIINEGSRYLVPRADGHVLAGATIEEAGFECHTTVEEVAGLQAWAQGIAEDLNEDTYVKSWAGLRPGTYDGHPYLGRLTGFSNAIVAAGHFKSGLQLSTGTAELIADLVQGKQPQIDLSPFFPGRVSI